MTYPDGAMATTSYSQGWLAGASWTQNRVTTPLLSAVSYSGASGALGAITSATVGQSAGAALYHTATQLDNDGRPTTTTLSRVSDGATLSNERLSYDPVGNVSAVSTTLPQGTDQQALCYDEQNRLTWAGTTSGNPCGNPASTGSFGGAGYTQAFGYDTLNRLTSGPLGSYTYGDTNHLHAATSVTSGYTASYDAAGDMTCRAPSGSTTCAGGSPTGQQLTWDAEGRLAAWQNAPTAPTTTATYLYDGEGSRVVQQVTDTAAGTTTTTSYIGSLETVTSDGTTTTTTDYAAAGPVRAEAVNGALSYLVTNYQGSVVEALDSSGVVTASQLYAPYGSVRYSSGAMPTDYGYTGQRSNASTGLDYYGARYYDPTLGQFTSADTLLAGGLNRYGYVGGNPTTATDPSGHMTAAQAELAGGIGVSTGMDEMEVALTIAGVGLAASTLAQQQGGGGVTSGSGDAANAAVSAAVAANTYAVAGGSVYVTATGALVVTVGATVTSYAVTDAGWLYWNEQISVATANDGAWSTPKARNWVSTHPDTKTIPRHVTKPGGADGGSLPGNISGGSGSSGVQIPAIPPIGIAIGIGIGVTSVDTGGPLSINWWRGLLFAKKADLKQLRAAARQAGIKDEKDIKEFGDWVEWYKHKGGLPRNYQGSFKELVEWAKEWLELYR